MASKRRGNGEGSIRKRKDGRWEARITLGYHETGKVKVKYLYGKTRRECAAKLNAFIEDNKRGTYIEPSRYTLGQWLDKWYEIQIVNKAKNATKTTYEMFIRCHIKPHLGHYKLKDLKSITIQDAYNKMAQKGRLDGKGGLSHQTLKGIHSILRQSLQIAYINDLIPKNPVADGRVSIPKPQKEKPRKVFSPMEQKAIETACAGSPWGVAILLALYTGLRRGELLGLTWQDIDFIQDRIHVNKQLCRIKNNDQTSPQKTILTIQPSTKSGKDRTIEVPHKIMEILQKHKKQEEYRKKQYSHTYQDNNLVFCKENGQFINLGTFDRFFKHILKTAGITTGSLHTTRHTFTTRALEAEIPMKIVSDTLGHSDIKITLNVYSHASSDAQRKAMERIADQFLNTKEWLNDID